MAEFIPATTPSTTEPIPAKTYDKWWVIGMVQNGSDIPANANPPIPVVNISVTFRKFRTLENGGIEFAPTGTPNSVETVAVNDFLTFMADKPELYAAMQTLYGVLTLVGQSQGKL